MAHGTTYSATKSLLRTRLGNRAALNGVTVRYQPPVNPTDINSVGSREAIWFADSEGDFDNVVACDGGLRFDETIVIPCVAQVLGADSLDDQETVDRRVEEIAYEILAEIASDAFRVAVRDDSILGAFDYVIVTPATQTWNAGRLPQQGSAHASSVELGIEIRSRRNYP